MIWVGQSPQGVVLRALIRVAEQEFEVDGSGETILLAHADLCRRVAEPTLASAFRQVLDASARPLAVHARALCVNGASGSSSRHRSRSSAR